jgi:GTP-binding protein HflX
VEIRKGQPILLTDTVGFIRRLPHELVDAFHSTLEEVTLADLLVQVLDASDPEVDRHFDVTMTVIKELGAEKTPMILALNKIDRVESPEGLETLRRRYADGVFVSALTGQGLEDLARRMDLSLSGPLYQFQFPPNRHDLVALLHRSGSVVTEQYTDNRIYIEARVGDRVLGTLKEWLQEPTGST